MLHVNPLESVTPALSVQVWNFSAEDPGGWQPLLDQAVAADRAGIDRIVVADHVAFGEDLDAYGDPKSGGTVGGRQPTGPDGHWLEPMTLLSVIAGRTSHIRLATGILQAALRRPAVLAKTAATLDVLSGGRLDLGVGVGWQRAEYVAAGLAFEGRGRLLDETLERCQALWRDQVVEIDGEPIHQMPKPVQPGGVPIWVSGRLNRRVLERLVRFGSGWIPWGDEAEDPVAALRTVREYFAEKGRDIGGLQVQGSLPLVRTDDGLDLDATMRRVPDLVEGGVTDFRAHVTIPVDPAEAQDFLSGLAAAFRAVVGR